MNPHHTQPISNDWGPLSQLPGNPLMWVLILSELLVFSAFFVLYAWMRSSDPALYNLAQQQLNPLLGGINTLILLTSGLFAALAGIAIARGNPQLSRRWLLWAMVGGALFCVVKLVEYSIKFRAGIGLEEHSFFTFYYLLTGFHFAHVLFGLGLLGVAYLWCTRENVATTTAFWHMVDLIWVILYPLFYLMR